MLSGRLQPSHACHKPLPQSTGHDTRETSMSQPLIRPECREARAAEPPPAVPPTRSEGFYEDLPAPPLPQQA